MTRGSQSETACVTEMVKISNQGHSLAIEHGWREVAQTALDLLKHYAPAARPGEHARGQALDRNPMAIYR